MKTRRTRLVGRPTPAREVGTDAGPRTRGRCGRSLQPKLSSEVNCLPIEALRAYSNNARKHPRGQLKKLEKVMRDVGFVVPVLVDRYGELIAGHARLEVAQRLGMTEVPTIRLDHLTPAQVKAFRIFDNRIAEDGDWDPEKLAVEFEQLLEIDFDLDLTGFEPAEIDLAFASTLEDEDDLAADALPERDPDVPVVSRPSDLWHLGEHRLMCGDATKWEELDRLLDGEQAQMAFVDPPYNVAIDGNVSGHGAVRHRDFAMASGEMSEAEFTTFLSAALQNLADYSVDGSIHFVCMDWRHMEELLVAGRDAYTELKNLCVWVKTNGGMGSLYRSQHELIFVYKVGTGAHINNVELGRHGRNRTNVWTHAGVNSLGADRLEELRMHPTVKPVALIADAILDCSHRSGLILDSFAGSGSTVIAAEKTGRRAYALEIDPTYVDTAVRRWQTFTGESAVLHQTGETFDQIAKERTLALKAASDQKEAADAR